MNGGGSPSSGRFLAQGTVAEAGVGGYDVGLVKDTWGQVTGFPRRSTGAAVVMQKEWMGSCSLLQKGRNCRRCSRTKTHGSWNRSFNVSRTR